MIDSHSHIYSEEFDQDRDQVVARALSAGVSHIILPNENAESLLRIRSMREQWPEVVSMTIGLHPEEVRADYKEVLARMHAMLLSPNPPSPPFIAIGEVGMDYYWSREFATEQAEAFEEQVRWSVETRLPLMIHCRKAQNEMVNILKRYARELPGGVFHCFTGNSREAEELLQFDGFVLGIGGVLTFRKSHLPEVLRDVPLSRIVLETDSPYMAPVPMRGNRNESAYVIYVLRKLAESLGVSEEEVARQTNDNVRRVFGIGA